MLFHYTDLGLGVIFGILFGLCLLLLLVVLISFGALILKNKLHHKTTQTTGEQGPHLIIIMLMWQEVVLKISDNRDVIGGVIMTIQTNSAYEAVKFSGSKKHGQHIDVMYEELQTLNTAEDTAYEMVSIKPILNP